MGRKTEATTQWLASIPYAGPYLSVIPAVVGPTLSVIPSWSTTYLIGPSLGVLRYSGLLGPSLNTSFSASPRLGLMAGLLPNPSLLGPGLNVIHSAAMMTMIW